MRSAVQRLLVFLSFVAAIAAMPDVAAAQDRNLLSGPAVRRQLLYRSDRFELAPVLGSSIAPVYQRSIFLSVAARYHLTNAFSLGANVNVSPVQLDTSVARNFEELERERLPADRASIDYASPLALLDVHLSYVPAYGKVNMLGNILHWDVFLTGGVGGALVTSDADDLGGFKFGPALGVGLRTFLNDKFAFNVLFQNYLYSSAEAQRSCCGVRAVATPVEETFKSHVIGSAGVSIFFPAEVRVSR